MADFKYSVYTDVSGIMYCNTLHAYMSGVTNYLSHNLCFNTKCNRKYIILKLLLIIIIIIIMIIIIMMMIIIIIILSYKMVTTKTK